MGPTIILDKSALQALSQHDLTALHRYYMLNLVPVLLVEVLADLKKPSAAGLSKDTATQLARKTHLYSAAVNVHYLKMLEGSLMGNEAAMDGRVALGGGRTVRAVDGQKGVIFERTPEEMALLRWQNGDFNAAEEALAERWRSSTRGFDVETFRSRLKTAMPRQSGMQDLASLRTTVESLMNAPEHQTGLLTLATLEFGLQQSNAQRVFLRWETQGPQVLAAFAPFACYCLKVNVFFNLGLAHGLIGTRRTNRVDLEYLYYLPFCNVFCSGDRFHADIVPLFLRPNQRFVKRDDLKPDLARLSADLATAGPSGVRRTPAESLTALLWSQFVKRPMSDHGWLPPEAMGRQASPELLDFLESRRRAAEIPEGAGETGRYEPDFVIRELPILGSAPCPCGRPKTFAECHGKNMAAERRSKANVAGDSPHQTGAEERTVNGVDGTGADVAGLTG